MELIELSKQLGGLPLSVLLIAALITVWIRGERREREHREEVNRMLDEHAELTIKYDSLLREAVAALTRAVDVLR